MQYIFSDIFSNANLNELLYIFVTFFAILLISKEFLYLSKDLSIWVQQFATVILRVYNINISYFKKKAFDRTTTQPFSSFLICVLIFRYDFL